MTRRKLIQVYTSINRRFEVRYFNLILRSLKQVAREVGEIVERRGPHAAMQELNNMILTSGVAATVRRLYTEVGLNHARRSYRELRQEEKVQVKRYHAIELPGLGFSAEWTAHIQDILKEFLTDKILFQASEQTKKMLLKVLSEGIEKGWSIDKMVSNMEGYPGLRYQAARIARTEVNRAANIGIMAGGSSFKFEQNKEWIAIQDRRTRGVDPEDHANHYRMNGQVVDFDSHFIDPRNKDRLMQPGDPKAKAESTINCRCTMALVAKRDARGRLIRKRGITVIRPGEFQRNNPIITI